MKKNIQVHQVLLITAFFVMVSFPLLSKATGLEYQTALYNVEIASKPGFSLGSYWNGSYQSAYDRYYSTNLGNYPALVKTYAQLRYDAFDQISNGIVMEDGNFIQEFYIHNFLQTEEAKALNSAQLSDLYSKLEQLKILLDTQNKDLIILVNPGKADFLSDVLPLRFQWRATYHTKNSEKLGDLLLVWAKQNSVPCVDGSAVATSVDGAGIPAFYHGGYHASKPAMFWISQELSKTMQNMGYQVKQIQFAGYAKSSKPHYSMDDGNVGSEASTANPDGDFESNSNLFRYSANDEVFYYPQYSVVADDYHDLPDIFLIGKSFNRDIQFYLSRAGIGNRVFHCQTSAVYIDSNFNGISWNNRDTKQMRQDLAASEIVVLEYNEYNNPETSILLSIDELLELLNTPAPQADGIDSFNAAVPSSEYTNYVRGFYKAKDPAPSEGFYWMMKNGGAVNLSANGKFKPQTIVLDCSIPADAFQAFWQKDISEYEYLVYINGQKVGSFPVGNERRETFCFDLQGIGAPNGEYCIEIIAPLYVQWKDIDSKSTDSRELSLRVYSCSLSAYTVTELKEGTT